MNALLITLKLQDSALFTGLGNGEENSSRTLPYIPGAALRGALIANFQSQNEDLLNDEDAVKLFFGDHVQFLNAYPDVMQTGQRALPVPASWRKQKGAAVASASVIDVAIQSDDVESSNLDELEGKQYQPIGKYFCANSLDDQANPLDDQFLCFNLEEDLAIHIASQNRGKVKRGDSTVFQYQALEKGQTFIAVILADDTKDLAYFAKILKAGEYLRLGRSRSARYGRVLIEKVEEKKEHDVWQEYEPAASSQLLTLTFLSDAVLRDEYGQPTLDLDGYLTRLFSKETEVTARKTFIQAGMNGGFNRKWALPLPQLTAIGMGSVFVYDAKTFTPAEQKSLMEKGIGERRVDGFGRVAVNWQANLNLTLQKPEKVKAPEFQSLSPESKLLAQKMAERLLRKELDGLLLATAQTHAIHGNITNHQLSRLRGLLRAAINQKIKDPAPIQNFLTDLKKTAQSQFDRARVISKGGSGMRLWNWLNEELKNPNKFDGHKAPVVAGEKAAIGETLRMEYTLRFVEMVVDKAMKSERKDGQS